MQGDNPRLLLLQEQQRELKALLNQEGEQVVPTKSKSLLSNPEILRFQNTLRSSLVEQLVQVERQLQVLSADSQALKITKEILEQQAQQSPSILRQYNDLQQQLELANRTLNQLLTQRDTLQVEIAQSELPWELISPPQIEIDAAGIPIPAPTKLPRNLALGMIGGFLLGLTVAGFLERKRNIFFSVEDIRDSLEMPVLSVIPYQEQIDSTIGGPANNLDTERIEDSTSLFLRSFDTLYSKLSLLYQDPSIRSLVVTSPESEDGKSTVALYLAQAAAAMDRRVLLVDTNWQLPYLHQLLEIENLMGINDLLLSQDLIEDFNGSFSKVIQKSSLANNLFVITAGQPLPRSTRLLASPRMRDLMDSFESNFDLVIYDAPYLFGSTNIDFLGANTDGMLMVIGMKKTKRSKVIQAFRQLDAYQIPCLGVVVNHASTSLSTSGFSSRHLLQRGYQQLIRDIPEAEKVATH